MKINDFDVTITGDGVTVGCTFVPRKTVEKIYQKMATLQPLKKGAMVKVVSVVDDSRPVLNKVGKVITIDNDGVQIFFKGWNEGWGRGQGNWYVARKAIEVVETKQ